MKGVLTAVASVLAMGVLFAEASVSGSNNIVVVEKEVRQSSTGWQLLCVPVNGFSISNATTGTIDVNDFLPGSYYENGSKIYILNGDGSTPTSPSYTLTDGVWVGDTTTTLTGGQSFWVKNVAKEAAAATSLLLLTDSGDSTSDSSDPIYFCGQERTRTALERPDAGTVSAMKNDGATAVTLNALVTSPKTGDEILVIQNGSKNYLSYFRNKNTWIDSITGDDVGASATILPGEAFYYQSTK